MSARRSPTCDPIHHAGYLTCPICEAPAWASEATWLDNDCILATYVPTCSHAAEQVSVVDGGGHQ
jgi:hypothetical protein